MTAADEIGVSQNAIYAACKRGVLAHSRSASGIRIAEDDLRAYVAGKLHRQCKLRGKEVRAVLIRVEADQYLKLAAYSKAQNMSINCAVNEWLRTLPSVEEADDDDCSGQLRGKGGAD